MPATAATAIEAIANFREEPLFTMLAVWGLSFSVGFSICLAAETYSDSGLAAGLLLLSIIAEF